MNKLLKKPSFIALLFVVFLIPKIYFLVAYHKNGFFETQKIQKGGDGSHYLRIGKNIHDFGVFSDDNSKSPSESATWRPPLWPFVLAVFFYFTSNLFGLIIFKSVLELLLLLIAILMIRRLSEIKPIHYLLFFLILIEPYYLKYSTTFLSESLTAVLILLLAISFVLFNQSKKYSILIPLLSVFVILCHPVSVFFVLALLIIYGLSNLRGYPKRIVFHGILVVGLMAAWPLRNAITFNSGFYLTASQGATFSKGWNEKVVTDFTNVDGDLADESINLKYLENRADKDKSSTLKLGKLYKEGTFNFIKTLNFQDILRISFVKLKSNFNPFPEKPKEGNLEGLATFFRILYIILFLQCFYRIFKRSQWLEKSEKNNVYLIVFAIMIGQILMSVFIYTGVRFNSIYGITLLFSFIYINKGFLSLEKRRSLN